MSVNLLQAYVIKNSAVPQQQQQPASKTAPHFDIQKELDNRAFIKPLKGKGKLLNGNVFNAPIRFLKDTIYSVKALKHAVQGQANDHELGKINDVGLKFGGLGIASYLLTKKVTPMTKGMEFVGFASFLASMSLWPKLAIQLPAYLVHGVNVRKEYEDSFGRKKPFYQDPQFIPWDLYKEEEIYKIGDRLGVPKDIPNRRDFIQEKMRKIAIQNNTLWMLTAGFATPIMSALICNQTEPYLTKYFNDRQNKKADGILNDISKYSKKYRDNGVQKNIDNIIKLNQGKPLGKELVNLITDTLSQGVDLVSQESLKKDIQSLTENKKFVITETTAQEIADNIRKIYADKYFSQEFIDNVLFKKEDIMELLTSNDLAGRTLEPKDGITVKKIIHQAFTKKFNVFNQKLPEALREDIKYVRGLLGGTSSKDNPVSTALERAKISVLDEGLQTKLKSIAKILDDFRAKNYALDEYAIIKTGLAPETVTANFWNSTKKEMLKAFGFSSKDIENARVDRSVLDVMLRDKIEKIVSDKKSYEGVLDAISKQVASLHNHIKQSDMAAVFSNPESTAYENMVDSLFDNHAKNLKEAGFTRLADAITGGADSVGSYKNIQKAFVSENLLGIESSLNRIINNLIVYRQIADNPNQFPALGGYVRETKEELLELCKIITLQGHSSDYATKFYMKRNPAPVNDYSPIESKNGKVINKYFDASKGGVDIPNDKYFYQNAMRLMYETDIDSDTLQILERYQMKDRIIKYRTLILEKLGGDYYFPKPRHLIRAKNVTPSDIKFKLTGMATDEYFFKALQESFNSNKWLKVVSGIGAGVLGVTLISQFFFGKMKNPRQQ